MIEPLEEPWRLQKLLQNHITFSNEVGIILSVFDQLEQAETHLCARIPVYENLSARAWNLRHLRHLRMEGLEEALDRSRNIAEDSFRRTCLKAGTCDWFVFTDDAFTELYGVVALYKIEPIRDEE